MSELVIQGDKKLKGGFMSFLTGVPYDEAQDLYEQAVNQLKLEKDWVGAADVYIYKLIPVGEKTQAPRFQMANWYVEAAKCLAKIDPKKSLAPYESAIKLFQADGKYMNAGNHLKAIAESLEESQIGDDDAELIQKYYERACDMFDMDDYGKSKLSQCRLKLAESLAKAGRYKEAIDKFEEEGRKALQNSLQQYSAKDHFFKAGCLHLVRGDVTTCNIARTRYCQDDPRFEKSLEGELFSKLVDALENQQEQDFVNALAEYNDIKPLDPWFVTHLTTVRESLQASAQRANIAGHTGKAGAAADDDFDLS